MIVDSSALLAVLFNKRDAETYARAITVADDCRARSEHNSCMAAQMDKIFRSAKLGNLSVEQPAKFQ